MKQQPPLRLTNRGWFVITVLIIIAAAAINIALSDKCVTWSGITPCNQITFVERNSR